MCLDLVARHFSLCSSQTINHSASPTRFTDGNEVCWLFLPHREGSSGSIDEMALLEKHIGNLKWKINANEKSLLFNSTISALMSSGKATFHPLYTMSLDPVLVPAKASYGTMGWHVEDGKDWFLNAYPNKANLAAYEQFWVVRNSSGEVGGFTSTLCEPHSNNQRGRLYVSDLLVHEQFRGQGLAKILLRHVVNRSRAGDGSEDPKFPAIVCLTVFCENIGAVGLYLGEGFRIDESIWVIESL